MTNKIIESAKAAGGTTYTNRHYPDAPAAAFGPEALRDFYALAYRQALEDAAKVATQIDLESQGVLPIRVALISSRIAKSILALKEQDTAIAAGKGEG